MPDPKPSTTASGNTLRSTVADLLRARYGEDSVTEEVELAGGKAADIIFVPSDLLGQKPKYAVECKNWASPLTSKNINEIRSEYAAAIDNRAIQHLYIIAPLDVSATVKDTINGTPWITFFTFQSFQSSIVAFSTYLQYLISDFLDDGLPDYYIPSRMEGGALLHDHIRSWLDASDGPPLAIIAGYGMGKTTYARFLASELAQNAVRDPTAKIPVLIPLGQLTHQQSIRALVSYLFADLYKVPGYSYLLFDTLNKSGRFILIFDAFDEMKHAMTLADIQHNLEDIKNLIYPDTKALLMGRPDPFLDDDQMMLIHGKKKVVGKQFPSTKLASFRTVNLDYFSDDDILDFTGRFMSYYFRKNGKLEVDPLRFKTLIKKRVEELPDSMYFELAKRPVQARMIAELATLEDVEFSNANVFELYDQFVRSVLDREVLKDSRRPINADTRFDFTRRVAWWLWTRKRDGFFTFSDLPGNIIALVTDRRSATAETLIRELLVGSLLDRSTGTLLESKIGDKYYFAHKSYWEFFVCHHLLYADLSAQDIELVGRNLTVQLGQFLESVDAGGFVHLYRRLARHAERTHVGLLDIASRCPIAEDRFSILDVDVQSDFEVVMIALACRDAAESVEFREWEKYFFKLERRQRCFSGLAFGLAYWALTDQSQKPRVLGCLICICAVGLNRLADRKRQRRDMRVVTVEIDSDEERCLEIFLNAIEGIDDAVLVIDSRTLLIELVGANLIAIDEMSLTDLGSGTEEIERGDLIHCESEVNLDDVWQLVRDAKFNREVAGVDAGPSQRP